MTKDLLQRLPNTALSLTSAPAHGIKAEPADAAHLPCEIALVIVDAQKIFCDPQGQRGNDFTDAVAKKIQNLVGEFRKAAIPVYACWDSRSTNIPAFHEFTPTEDDKLIKKSSDSAFEGSDINDVLNADGRKMLLICGFNATACAYETARDGQRAGYNVCFLTDLVANDDLAMIYGDVHKSMDKLQQSGALTAPSGTVLETLADHNPSAEKVFNALTAKNCNTLPLPETLTAAQTARSRMYAVKRMRC